MEFDISLFYQNYYNFTDLLSMNWDKVPKRQIEIILKKIESIIFFMWQCNDINRGKRLINKLKFEVSSRSR